MNRFIQRLLVGFNLGEGHPFRNAIYLAGGILYVGCQVVFFGAPVWSPLRGTSLTIVTVLTASYTVDLFVQRPSRIWMWRTLTRGDPTERLVFVAVVVFLITGQIGISLGDRRLTIFSICGAVAAPLVVAGYYFMAKHGKQIWTFVLGLRWQ